MVPAEPATTTLTVTVSFSPRAGEVDEQVVSIRPGATVGDALAASGLQARHPEIELHALPLGVWGVRCDAGRLLSARDRVEVYRPLTVDPKEARRLRHRATLRSESTAGRDY